MGKNNIFVSKIVNRYILLGTWVNYILNMIFSNLINGLKKSSYSKNGGHFGIFYCSGREMNLDVSYNIQFDVY